MTTTENRPDTAADQRGKGPLPWIVLALVLALGALGAYLLVSSEDGTPGDTTAETVQGDAAAPGTGEAPADGTDTAPGDASADVRPGVIAAGGATVYPLQDRLTVGDFAGIEVTATNVPVESVAGDGFWVGTTPEDRVYVVADTSGLEPGALVSFTGVVRDHGADFAASVGVGDAEGAARLNALGGHVEAGAVTVTQG